MNTRIANDAGSQLVAGLVSWNTLQFVIVLIVIIGFVLTTTAIFSFLDRKLQAQMQDRIGPIHTGGPWGILQAVADVLKLLLKEQIMVADGDRLFYLLAPALFIMPIIGSFAVLPFSPYISIPGTALGTGLIYLVAMGSIDVMAVFIAGYSSNNKYAIIGAIRGVAQMISYELPLALSLVGIILLTSILAPNNSGIGTLAFQDIMNLQNSWQITHIPVLDFIFQGFTPWAWFILVQPLMLVIYYICGLAEANRTPFDLAEADSELVAGHLTEYSGVRWAMFMVGEYGNMGLISGVIAFFFLGGWSGPGVAYLVGMHSNWWGLIGNLLALTYLITKIYLLCLIFVWIRATIPRLRPDQLMRFAWLILMPVTLGNILLTALLYLISSAFGLPAWIFLVVLGLTNWVALYFFIRLGGKVRQRPARYVHSKREVREKETAS